MRPPFYDSPKYKNNQSLKTKENWKRGLMDSLKKELQSKNCQNPKCPNIFRVKPSDRKKFCSSRCSAIINNSLRPKKIRLCVSCQNGIKRRGYKFCTLSCQSKYRYDQFINKWKEGLENGGKGVNTRSLSSHVRRYLVYKYQERCSECGWKKRNIYSNKIPLEVDHKDGNSENNKEENLRLLCPNCHSLTRYFRNLNKGNGRKWRKNRYLRVSLGY